MTSPRNGTAKRTSSQARAAVGSPVLGDDQDGHPDPVDEDGEVDERPDVDRQVHHPTIPSRAAVLRSGGGRIRSPPHSEGDHANESSRKRHPARRRAHPHPDRGHRAAPQLLRRRRLPEAVRRDGLPAGLPGLPLEPSDRQHDQVAPPPGRGLRREGSPRLRRPGFPQGEAGRRDGEPLHPLHPAVHEPEGRAARGRVSGRDDRRWIHRPLAAPGGGHGAHRSRRGQGRHLRRRRPGRATRRRTRSRESSSSRAPRTSSSSARASSTPIRPTTRASSPP